MKHQLITHLQTNWTTTGIDKKNLVHGQLNSIINLMENYVIKD